MRDEVRDERRRRFHALPPELQLVAERVGLEIAEKQHQGASLTIAEIEKLLDSRQLQAEMRNGRWWDIRRNGVTKRWKRDPDRFQIPIKAGLRSYGYIDRLDLKAQGIRIKGDG